ncbi:MAG: ABC transporter ATP-binding protein [Acutalibacteraceae bacterium]|nr:ABC transporter ATP-binding protein [Acutalibacteraceae bacterium]
MAEAKTMIKFDNVSKDYILFKNDRERFKSLFFKPKNAKHHMALKNVSLEIFEGESVGIIGDNGAGKSTLLKMITGVAFPDSGEVNVNGSVAALLELTAGFALEMSGRENIYLRGYTLGLKDSYIKEIEPKIIEFAELGDYIDQPVRTYSSGMKMRLGFAINVNIDPDILVIDEALSVGDATFKKKCKNRVGEIIKAGKTVLFVSHSKDSVKEMCQKAIYLKKGEVKFAGDVNEAFVVYEADKAEKKKK